MGNTINYNNYPPIIHYMGKEYMGGMVSATEDDMGFIIPVIELGTSQTNMVFTEFGTLTEYTGGDMS